MKNPIKSNRFKDPSSLYEADREGDPKFYTKDGWLTLYALACGYKEMVGIGSYTVEMYQDGCFHVRAHNWDAGEHTWDCYDTVTEARKAFVQMHNRVATGVPA